MHLNFLSGPMAHGPPETMLHPRGVLDAGFDDGLIAVRLHAIQRRPLRPISQVDRFAIVPLDVRLHLLGIQLKRDRPRLAPRERVGDELRSGITPECLLDTASYRGDGRFAPFFRGLLWSEERLDGLSRCFGFLYLDQPGLYVCLKKRWTVPDHHLLVVAPERLGRARGQDFLVFLTGGSYTSNSHFELPAGSVGTATSSPWSI